MENTRQFVGLKDVLLVTLLSALCIVIVTIAVLPFSANILLVLWGCVFFTHRIWRSPDEFTTIPTAALRQKTSACACRTRRY